MPAAAHMPRTRRVRFALRLGGTLTFIGAGLTLLSVIDLVDGKDAVTETVSVAAVLAVGVCLLIYGARARASALAKDWAAMPSTIRRDLPFGAQETDNEIVLHPKLSWFVGMVVLAAGSAALAVFGVVDVPGSGGLVVAGLFTVIMAAFVFLARYVRGLRWIVDAEGIRQEAGPRRMAWSEITVIHVDPRGRFVNVVGNGATGRLFFSSTLLETPSAELAALLGKGPALFANHSSAPETDAAAS